MDHCLRAAANADAELHRAQSLRPPRAALCRNRPCNDSTPDRAHRDRTDAARWLSEGHQPRGPKRCAFASRCTPPVYPAVYSTLYPTRRGAYLCPGRVGVQGSRGTDEEIS